MSDDDYARGLEKLGLTTDTGWPKGTRDLRTDPAFAWRVQEALFTRSEYVIWNRYTGCIGLTYRLAAGMTPKCALPASPTMADALYTAVCAFGREE